jgi:hypothetical protein
VAKDANEKKKVKTELEVDKAPRALDWGEITWPTER